MGVIKSSHKKGSLKDFLFMGLRKTQLGLPKRDIFLNYGMFLGAKSNVLFTHILLQIITCYYLVRHQTLYTCFPFGTSTFRD